MSGIIWNQFRKASRSTATLFAPLGDHVKAYEAKGEDMTVAVRNEFYKTQQELMMYRQAKFYQELAYFRTSIGGLSLATFSIKDVVCISRTWVRFLAVFIATVMLGRSSYFPLLEPDSPFVEGLKYQNPNYVLDRYQEAVKGDDH